MRDWWHRITTADEWLALRIVAHSCKLAIWYDSQTILIYCSAACASFWSNFTGLTPDRAESDILIKEKGRCERVLTVCTFGCSTQHKPEFHTICCLVIRWYQVGIGVGRQMITCRFCNVFETLIYNIYHLHKVQWEGLQERIRAYYYTKLTEIPLRILKSKNIRSLSSSIILLNNALTYVY